MTCIVSDRFLFYIGETETFSCSSLAFRVEVHGSRHHEYLEFGGVLPGVLDVSGQDYLHSVADLFEHVSTTGEGGRIRLPWGHAWEILRCRRPLRKKLREKGYMVVSTNSAKRGGLDTFAMFGFWSTGLFLRADLARFASAIRDYVATTYESETTPVAFGPCYTLSRSREDTPT